MTWPRNTNYKLSRGYKATQMYLSPASSALYYYYAGLGVAWDYGPRPFDFQINTGVNELLCWSHRFERLSDATRKMSATELLACCYAALAAIDVSLPRYSPRKQPSLASSVARKMTIR